MTPQKLQGQILGRPNRIEQAETMRGGAENAAEIGVIGLVVGIGRLTVLLRREGMHDARVEAGLPERALHRPMILAGSFDRDDDVAELVLVDGLAKPIDGCMK